MSTQPQHSTHPGQPQQWTAPPPPKRRRWVHFLGYPLAIIVALGVGVAIGSAGGSTSNGIGKDVVSSQPDPSASPAGQGQAAKKPSGLQGYGSTVKFSDGSTLTVTAPKKFDTSTGVGNGGGTPVRSTVTFTNGGAVAFDPVTIYTTMASGGRDAEAIFDSEKGVAVPENKVQPGKSTTFKVAFGAADPAKTTLTVSFVGLDYDEVTYSNDN